MTSTLLPEFKAVSEQADCVATAAEIEAAYAQMAVAINRHLYNRNPLVLAVLNGGLIVSGQLVSRLHFPLELSYLHLTRYGRQLHGEGIEWVVRPSQTILQRTVLVIDDVLDEGQTLTAIIDWLKDEGAAEVLTAVLVHKDHDRKAIPGMRADFTGLIMPDRYLFGGGMDYKGYGRNAPGIFAVKDS